LGNDLRDRNLILKELSLVNIARHEAITSGEMYPALVIFSRLSTTSSLAEKRSFGSVGNGM
jgi:hypothetical protein